MKCMFGYPFHASIATPPSFAILEINYLATLFQACFRPTHLKAIVNLETRRRKRKKGRVTGKERGKNEATTGTSTWSVFFKVEYGFC